MSAPSRSKWQFRPAVETLESRTTPDAAGVQVTPLTPLWTTEDGGAALVSVVLTSRPTARSGPPSCAARVVSAIATSRPED